tara:strand:+ start:135 stop:365 length:231 start_codon:yes stop_codon:yes gene_type:complete
MVSEPTVKEFVEKVLAFEAEKKELAEAEKELYNDYKDKLDVKAFRAALRIAKIRSKLDSDVENDVDKMLAVVSDKV